MNSKCLKSGIVKTLRYPRIYAIYGGLDVSKVFAGVLEVLVYEIR